MFSKTWVNKTDFIAKFNLKFRFYQNLVCDKIVTRNYASVLTCLLSYLEFFLHFFWQENQDQLYE